MADRPYVRFWVSDWLGSGKRRGMTLAETGAYINLLATAWQSEDCSLPDDDSTLARLSEAFGEWDAIKAKIRECFRADNGKLYNDKLLRELKYFSAQAENGRKGGEAKAKRLAKSCPTPSQPPSQIVASHKLIISEAQSTEAQNLKVSDKPLSVGDTAADDGLDDLFDLDGDSDAVAGGDGLTPVDTRARKKVDKTLGFDDFWKAFPPSGKESRIKANNEWVKAGCYKIIPEVMSGLERAKASERWLKDGGKYVRHAHSWLKDGGWTNELEPARRNGAPRPGVFT